MTILYYSITNFILYSTIHKVGYISRQTCFPHFQSGPRITLAPTPSIINLVVRTPVPPPDKDIDEDAAPPIAPASKLKLSKPNVPPTEAPDIERLLAAVGAMDVSAFDWLLAPSPVELDITLVVVVRGRVGGAAGIATGRFDAGILDVAVIMPWVGIRRDADPGSLLKDEINLILFI